MATAPSVLTSTTSHKREPLLPTLELFSRLDLRDLDLNLHHILEDGVTVDSVVELAAARGLHVWVVSGGWCDFFQREPQSEQTDRSVARQVHIAHQLGAAQLRLFFGRLKFEDYSQRALETVCANLWRLSDRHPDMAFMFENHDGASLHPDVCRNILERVDRPNLLMNFDPINFERAGVSSMGGARDRPSGGRPRPPERTRPRRVLRVRRRRRRSHAGAAGPDRRTAIEAGSRWNTKARTTGRCGCSRAFSGREPPCRASPNGKPSATRFIDIPAAEPASR